MDLYEFREMFISDEQNVRICDLNKDAEIIYEGEFRDLPDELEDKEICSIDNIYPDNDGYIEINI